jgi:hypothetical protein
MTATIKYPHIKVKLVGTNGNAFAILGAMRRALAYAKVPKADIDAFLADAMSGDYDHLLATCMNWVDVH